MWTPVGGAGTKRRMSVRSGDTDFITPDWHAPVDLEALLDQVPPSATIRALFSANLVEAVRAAGKTLPVPRTRFHGFEEIPLRDHMRMMAEAAALLWPHDPLRIGLRRFGRGVRASVERTTFGRVSFAAATDALTSLQAMSHTYRAMLRYDVPVTMVSAREARVEMRGVLYYCDSCHVGVVEGMLLGVGLKPTVRVAMRDRCNGVFQVTW